MSQKFDVDVPVLVVGGGGAGLTASVLLARLGIRSLLVTRYPETTRVPRGHILNQRTMEIFTEMGLAPEILELGTPPENMRGLGWYSGLAGGGPANGHGRRIGFIEAWGAGYTDPDYIAASPCPASNLSLLRLEPILKARAEQYHEATVRFHHELVDIEQDADGVTSTVLNRDTGKTYTVRSSYVLGADAGRTVADLVGIERERSATAVKLTGVYMAADLSEYLREADDGVIIWIFNPEAPQHLGYGGVLVSQGPDWGRHSKEWVLQMAGGGWDTSNPDEMLEWGREVLGVPDLHAEILGVSRWEAEGVMADRFREGRVFLLGDAAHKVPPMGGLGLNAAVQDAYNLCWKLALVLQGQAGDVLLDTYESERRPVNQANLDTALRAVASYEGMIEAMGVSPEKGAEENWAAMQLFWEDGPGAAERRHEWDQWLSGRTIEYHQHGTDYGYTYEDSTAIVADGSPAPARVDAARLYQPSTRPGHPLPHAWVERAGERVALRSLLDDAHFALIAGEDGQAWVDAAVELAERRGLRLRAARVGLGKVDYVDVRLAWLKQREISSTGAVLVRPDGHVAYRSAEAVEDPGAALDLVFAETLATAPERVRQAEPVSGGVA
jgi:2,4-dichlorophenol 6-monooxygenase